jgi:hypothetical protein
VLQALLSRSPSNGEVYGPYVMNSVFIAFRLIYIGIVLIYRPYHSSWPMVIPFKLLGDDFFRHFCSERPHLCESFTIED